MVEFKKWAPRQIRTTGDVPVRGTGVHDLVEFASVPLHLRHRLTWEGLGCWMWHGEPVVMALAGGGWDADGREVASCET